MNRWSVALLIFTMAAVVAMPAAHAGDGLGGTGTDGEYELTVQNEVGEFAPDVVAERPHEDGAEAELICARGRTVTYTNPDGSPWGIGYECTDYYSCGAERIDDVYSGRIAGVEVRGVYGEYLDYVVNSLAPDVVQALSDDFRERLSASILEFALGDPEDHLALPVFHYCRIGVGGPLELELVNGMQPRFRWDTTVGEEYDIPGNIDRLVDELRVRLTASPPPMQAIPPLDEGKTFVRFPMWFWLEDPVLIDGVWAESSGETIRLQVRAALDRVEWAWGDETFSCAVDDMRPWTEGLHPFDDRPVCHHIVDRLGAFDLTARAVYSIEQNISIRAGAAVPFEDTPWFVGDTAEISVAESVGPIEVRELLSLNTSRQFGIDS